MADEKANGAETEAEPKKPTCFVVSPIGAAGSPERKHANVTLRFIIEPVLERCGFQKNAEGRHALRADTLGEVGIISRQIISQLLNADLVIADLTGRNPNVFYELAIRHGTGKPFVQLMAKGEVLPFDVGHQRTIFFDRTDLEDVEDCKVELEKQVKSAMAAVGPIETPIGQTLDYEKLRSGGNVEQALARLADQMAGIQREQHSPARAAADAVLSTILTRRLSDETWGAGVTWADGGTWGDGGRDTYSTLTAIVATLAEEYPLSSAQQAAVHSELRNWYDERLAAGRETTGRDLQRQAKALALQRINPEPRKPNPEPKKPKP